jgi:hypothetical protein
VLQRSVELAAQSGRSSDSKPEGDRFKSYPRNHFHYNSLTVPD